MIKVMNRILHTFQQSGETFGLLSNGFQFSLQTGYTALIGTNDSGKSTILQFVFKSLFQTSEISRGSYCLIPANRYYVTQGTRSSMRLDDYNKILYEHMQSSGAPIPSEKVAGPDTSLLYSILLQTRDLPSQLRRINELLAKLDLPGVMLPNQTVTIEEFDITRHGAGLRHVFPILAALTADDIKYIVIDEPELSLEPRAQKALKGLLFNAIDSGKVILVATQSHIFLHREKGKESKNIVVKKNGRSLTLSSLQDRVELMNATYSLLGNSLEDLFFPSNFLLVEGASDQRICEKVIELLGWDSAKVKVLSVRGIDNAGPSYQAIVNTLTPLTASESPYKKRVVVLVDKAVDENSNLISIKKALDTRFFSLESHSIEDYIPDELYAAAGRNKVDDQKSIEDASQDYARLNELKREISNSIAEALTTEHLTSIQKIHDAVRMAGECANF
jgi:hypothetical protein